MKKNKRLIVTEKKLPDKCTFYVVVKYYTLQGKSELLGHFDTLSGAKIYMNDIMRAYNQSDKSAAVEYEIHKCEKEYQNIKINQVDLKSVDCCPC